MRRISFMLTRDQVLSRTKDVTRRLGWTWLVAACARGERPRLLGVSKCMGLKPGEKPEAYCAIEVVNARREPLFQLTLKECRREGFPEMNGLEFVEFFCASHKGCELGTEVTRIEFRYLDPSELTPTELAQCQRAGLFTDFNGGRKETTA